MQSWPGTAAVCHYANKEQELPLPEVAVEEEEKGTELFMHSNSSSSSSLFFSPAAPPLAAAATAAQPQRHCGAALS